MDRDPQEHRAPLWMRLGIWLVAASGPLPFMLGLAGLVDRTPPPWLVGVAVLACLAAAAAFVRPWRPDL
jgi:hypothetical protein